MAASLTPLSISAVFATTAPPQIGVDASPALPNTTTTTSAAAAAQYEQQQPLPLSSFVIASFSCVVLSCILLLVALSYFIRSRRNLYGSCGGEAGEAQQQQKLPRPSPSTKLAANGGGGASKYERPPQLPPEIRRFTWKQVCGITSDFRHQLGAELFRGRVGRTPVVVKKVAEVRRKDVERLAASVTELWRQRDAVKLVGVCWEGASMLMAVYEIEGDAEVVGEATLGALLGRRPAEGGGGGGGGGWLELGWEARYGIAIQVAETLCLLHEKAGLAHGEVTPENVVLSTSKTTDVEGSGEEAPKLVLLAGAGLRIDSNKERAEAKGGGGGGGGGGGAGGGGDGGGGAGGGGGGGDMDCMTVAADVYGFGLLLLSLLMGKPDIAIDAQPSPSFLEWVYLQAKQGMYDDSLDRRLLLQTDAHEVRVCLDLAFCCLQLDGGARPSMPNISTSLRHRHALGLPLLASFAFGAAAAASTTSDDSVDIHVYSPDLLLRSEEEEEEEEEEEDLDQEEQVVVLDVDHDSSIAKTITSVSADTEPCYQVFSLRRCQGRSFS